VTSGSASAEPLLAAAGSSGGGFTPLLLLVGLVAFTYLILIRPQRSRMRQLQQTQSTLIPGAEVMTTAGLYATVVEIDDQTVTLEIAPGVHSRFDRRAVARIITSPEEPATEDASAPEE
jgi:preprotein translocase subunit YajC